MTPDEARVYGLIDEVIVARNGKSVALPDGTADNSDSAS